MPKSVLLKATAGKPLPSSSPSPPPPRRPNIGKTYIQNTRHVERRNCANTNWVMWILNMHKYRARRWACVWTQIERIECFECQPHRLHSHHRVGVAPVVFFFPFAFLCLSIRIQFNLLPPHVPLCRSCLWIYIFLLHHFSLTTVFGVRAGEHFLPFGLHVMASSWPLMAYEATEFGVEYR